MQGNKHTFISSDNKTFHKEYTHQEFLFLKMLHGITNLPINTITHNNKEYITMPADHVISIDTIPKKRRNNIKHIIIKNIPYMLEQILYLNALNIYYSDALQWLYHNNKLYLIDFDTAYMTTIDFNYNNHNNYDLLINFLSAFNIDYSFISESLNYFQLFQDGISFFENEVNIYNSLNIPSMQKNHIYFTNNRRHIQIDVNNIHIYGENGNILITETVLNPELQNEWELIRIV